MVKETILIHFSSLYFKVYWLMKRNIFRTTLVPGITFSRFFDNLEVLPLRFGSPAHVAFMTSFPVIPPFNDPLSVKKKSVLKSRLVSRRHFSIV